MKQFNLRVQKRTQFFRRVLGMPFLTTSLNTVHSKSLHKVTIMLLIRDTHTSRLQVAWTFLRMFDALRSRLYARRNANVYRHTIKRVHERLEPHLTFPNAHHISEVKNLKSLYVRILDTRPFGWYAQFFSLS